ncbi:serpin B3 [Sturnira hondurensis]|uniref:serpin B3 n=1 Tax=Sturnira hondurensis TaxID=192404 RepID=UPI001879394A|nr:serpin B3 [Sturnira hondurensis]XP_036891387.1 serpin B3 [Sturnira hondurensis]
MTSLSEANTRFAYDLFQQLRKSEKKNIFYSPLSVSAAIAMTYLGAQGTTASEIQKALHFNEVTEKTKGGATTVPVKKLGNVHQQFQKLLTELNKPTNAYELHLANRLFAEKKFSFLQEYMDNVNTFYLAGMETVDFVNAADESRKKINSWVESQTKEKIKNLCPKDSINSATVLALVNAIYFKGQWSEKFNPELTEQGEFWLNKDTSKPVQMMKKKGLFNFSKLEGMAAKILEIPYKDNDLSMVLLLPNEIDGLQQLEEKLTAEKLTEWTSSQNKSRTTVALRLPRFKVEESYNLQEVMSALGMVAAFSPRDADFSGMTGSQELVVSKIQHKSFVEVTEEGTEAAAASAIIMCKSALLFVETFHCDHPFLFFIKHNTTNSILFFGRVASP